MTRDEIQSWLFGRLATLLEMSIDEVADANTVEELGADSLVVARLTEELRELTDAHLSPTLLYDSTTFDDLVAQIAAAMQPAAVAAPAARIAVAASFTIEPIEAPLGHLLDTAGIDAALAFAPYNQILQQLLDPATGFGSQAAVAHVVLLRIEDWFRHAGGAPANAAVEAVIGQLLGALEAARTRIAGPLLVALCPHDPDAALAMAEADLHLIGALETMAGIELLDLRDRGVGQYDVVRDRVGHIPYTPRGFAEIALPIGRALHRALVGPAKVLVVDCDNTLWGGVVGEDGASGIRIEPGHQALHLFLRKRKDAGQLIVLASKNSEDDVWAVFDSRDDMLLKREDIAGWRIDWNPKPGHIAALADELNLGLDSFIFLDDSPVECAAVAAALPEVTVVHMPADPAAFGPMLDAHWAFDTGIATAEDARRTELYVQERSRRQIEANSTGVDDYLASLGIEIDVTPLGQADLARAAQLTQRTNQFNTTTIRRSEAEVAALIGQAPPRALKVDVRDRFGDYGFVGLATLDWSGGLCRIDSLMLSCRVLGRRVEQALVRHIAALAAEAGVAEVAIDFVASDRNQPVHSFLRSIGTGIGADGAVRFAVADIDAVLAGTVMVAAPTETAVDETVVPAARKQAASEGLGWIAGLHGDGGALERALAARIRVRPDLDQPFLAPQTPLQVEIAKVWASVLRLDRVGIEDDFYELGGDSLAGAELAASLQDLGLPEDVGLGIAERPTVAGLAELVQLRRGGAKTQPTVTFEDWAALPADIRALAEAARGTPLPDPAGDGFTYLLTGGTGYVGGYLAARLLERPGVRLVCHVRARDDADGMARIRGNLERYGLWQPGFADRLSVAVGGLDKPMLGLDAALYDRLAGEVDAVIHNGAHVNFIFPASHLRAANVGGTAEALRFAAAGRVKPFHFVSTLGVMMSGYARDHVIHEDEELDHSEDLPNGYEQTKWVADKMVWHAIQAGYPASIYRLGMLSGLAESGVYHKLNEFLPSFLKGCVQLGSFPHMDSKIEMVPIDITVATLARLIETPASIGKTFHMNHPDPLDDDAFVEEIQALGYPLRYVPFDVWKRELIGSPALKQNALYPFLDFVRGLQSHQTRIPDMDMTNVLALAGDELRACPSQKDLLARYFAHFARVHYLPAPASVATSGAVVD